jgi:hypothetical protein
VKLERAESASTGRVTVLGIVDERYVRVAVELDDQPYHLAIQAHDSGLTLKLNGTLKKEGRGFVLKHPSDPIVGSE